MSPSRETGTAGEIWGHKFVWTAQHPEFEEVHRMLYTYDKLGNDALDRIDALSPPKPKDGTKCPMSQRDLYTLLGEHSKDDGVLGKLWNEVNTVPDWVDWEQIERGQRVVFQYNGQMLLGLLINSLLGGMAAWRVVETLARTGGFGTQVTRRRLLETSQHFLQCVENVDAVKPGGKGFVSSVRVRLLHATVRRRILELEKKKPGYFNIKEWGIPINDLHQIGTIDAYSTALVFISLPRQGIFLSEQQIADYLALWRWIGYVMGTPVEWMSSVGRAKAMMEVVMTSELDPTRNSQIIANNILTAQANVPPLHASRGYLTALTWRLNGADLSKRLAIAKPSWYHSTLAWVQCLILAANSYRYSHKSAGDQRKQDERFIKFGYEMITSQKHGGLGYTSQFEFQYTPNFGKMTEMSGFDTGSWNVAVIVVSTFTVVLLVVFTSNMVFPWHQLAAQRVGSMIMPAEQIMDKLF